MCEDWGKEVSRVELIKNKVIWEGKIIEIG